MHHVGASEVQGEALPRVKPSVPIGTDMLYALDVRRPRKFGRIEGAGDCEDLLRTLPSGAAHQLFDG